MNEPDQPIPPATPPIPAVANGVGTPASTPPALPSAPPSIAPPPLAATAAPSSRRKLAATLLSVFFGLVLANAAASLLDDSSVLLLGTFALSWLSLVVFGITFLATVLVYGLMAFVPAIPKRIFLPLVAFVILPFFVGLPVMIFYYAWGAQIDWFISAGELIFGLLLLRWLQGSWKLRWPLVPEICLGRRKFRWWHPVAFVLLNLFVALPAVVAYFGGCASLAVSHFTDGFMALRPSGVILQARKYTRGDGRTVVLFPMSHIAESDFYRSMAASVTSNSVVLLEGVTDVNNLLTNKLSYRRAARKLHLAEQHDDLQITRGTLVRADVDVQDFSSNTIAILNLAALVHSQGLNARTLSLLMQFTPSPEVEAQLFDDLLWKRNAHVLEELRTRLPQSDSFIIPWGAAHMSGLAREIQKSGFHLVATHDFVSIRFGGKPAAGADPGWISHPEKSN